MKQCPMQHRRNSRNSGKRCFTRGNFSYIGTGEARLAVEEVHMQTIRCSQHFDSLTIQCKTVNTWTWCKLRYPHIMLQTLPDFDFIPVWGFQWPWESSKDLATCTSSPHRRRTCGIRGGSLRWGCCSGKPRTTRLHGNAVRSSNCCKSPGLDRMWRTSCRSA